MQLPSVAILLEDRWEWTRAPYHPTSDKAELKKTKNQQENHTVDGRNPADQLGLVVYPIIYKVLYIAGGCLGFLNHQQYHVAMLNIHRFLMIVAKVLRKGGANDDSTFLATNVYPNQQGGRRETTNPQTSWWLNHPFEKYDRQHGFIFPNFRGENKKYLSCHHLANLSSIRWFCKDAWWCHTAIIHEQCHQ